MSGATATLELTRVATGTALRREVVASPWKRLLDVAVAAVALPLLSPLLLAVAALVKLTSAGPAIFAQRRVGLDGREFTLYKFRTMVRDAERRRAALEPLNECDGPRFKMRDDPRLTAAGRWLRRLSLDELPQLWNVLRGEMSLVGPRPPLPAEVAAYEPWQRRRLAARPGITGPWQVSGCRQGLSFDEGVGLDLDYIERWSIGLDLRTLAWTPLAILGRRGIY